MGSYNDFSKFYLDEIIYNVDSAKKNYDMYKDAYFKNNTELFIYIHYLLIHVANIHKLIAPNKDNSFRKKILSRINFDSIDLKSFKKIRNDLEHFDERLDTWLVDYGKSGHPFFDRNIITGCIGFPKKAYLRAIDGNIFRFFGNEIDINSLYSNLMKIEKIIKS